MFAYYRDGLKGGLKNEKIVYYEKRFTYVYRKTACTGDALFRRIRKGNLYRTNDGQYMTQMTMPVDVYIDYVCGSFTKTVCEAKNKNQLLKAKAIADELGLVEDIDYGCIYDNCLTELEPEEDNGTTLTGIWFCPLDDEIAHKISKKYQLYK